MFVFGTCDSLEELMPTCADNIALQMKILRKKICYIYTNSVKLYNGMSSCIHLDFTLDFPLQAYQSHGVINIQLGWCHFSLVIHVIFHDNTLCH